MLTKKLYELQSVADELRAAFASASAEAQKQLDEKEGLRTELWRVQKDFTTLKRMADEYDALAEANERYCAQRDQVREGLQRILKHAKALGLEYQE